MANVILDDVITGDLSTVDESDTRACEQILDKFMELSSLEQNDTIEIKQEEDDKSNILDAAWEETFGDLFPDLGECTF